MQTLFLSRVFLSTLDLQPLTCSLELLLRNKVREIEPLWLDVSVCLLEAGAAVYVYLTNS
jgi:hypothetical protein